MISKTFLNTILVAGAAATILAPRSSAADSTLVADFELQTNGNRIDGFWFYLDDKGGGGNSKVISGDTTVHPTIFSSASFGEPYSGVVGYSGKMEYILGTVKPSCGGTCTYSNEVTFGTNLEPIIGLPLDITGATGISFWAKATPPVKVSIIFLTKDIKDYSWARAEVAITGEWKRHTANFSGTTGIVFKSTYGTGKDKPLTLSQLESLNFAIQKDSNPGSGQGVLLLDDLVIHGWKSPFTAIGNDARASRTKALRAAIGGQSLRFAVPEAYRNLAGTVAAVDLSGKTVARAAFAKGQESVSLDLKQRSTSTVFLRVFTGSEAR